MEEARSEGQGVETEGSRGGGSSIAAVGAASTGVGAAFLATVTAACCAGPVIAPIVVAVLGASGAAWAAGLSPYTPYLFAGSALLLGVGFWMVHRPAAACGADRRRASDLVVRGVLWLAALVWLGSLAVAAYATWGPFPVG